MTVREGSWNESVRDVVCPSLGQASEGVERAEAALTLQRSLAGVLHELFGENWLKLFVKCRRDTTCASAVRVYDEDVRTMLVKTD